MRDHWCDVLLRHEHGREEEQDPEGDGEGQGRQRASIDGQAQESEPQARNDADERRKHLRCGNSQNGMCFAGPMKAGSRPYTAV